MKKPARAGFFLFVSVQVGRLTALQNKANFPNFASARWPARSLQRGGSCLSSANKFHLMHLLPVRFLLRSAAAVIIVALPTLGAAQSGPQLDLLREQLSAGVHRIEAQVAVTPSERQIGLMLRADMPSHEGMLFVFEEPAVQCFWMKNTLLPLTAAFVDDQGRIVNLTDMQPQTTVSHCSTAPVRYVLEMNQGWFAQRHIVAGARLSGARFASHPPADPNPPQRK